MFYDCWIEEQRSIYVVKNPHEKNIVVDWVKKDLLNDLNDEYGFTCITCEHPYWKDTYSEAQKFDFKI